MAGRTDGPFNSQQANLIQVYQLSVGTHPLTCPRRGETPHHWHDHPTGDFGVLSVAEIQSKGKGTGTFQLACLDCSYTQSWVPNVVLGGTKK